MEGIILIASLGFAGLVMYVRSQVNRSQIVPPFGLIAVPRARSSRLMRRSLKLFFIVLISTFAVFELLQVSIASLGRMLIGI